MKNWFNWLLKKNKIPSWLIYSGFILALIGFSDAGYLTMKYLQDENPKCFITTGCEAVTTSSYSKIGPFPVAGLGLFFYTTILFLFFLGWEKDENKWDEYALAITPIGFLFTIYFLFIQAFKLETYCIYCLISAATSTSLFGLAVYHWIKMKKIITK